MFAVMRSAAPSMSSRRAIWLTGWLQPDGCAPRRLSRPEAGHASAGSSIRDCSRLPKLQQAPKAFLQLLQFLQPPIPRSGGQHEKALGSMGWPLGNHQPGHQTRGAGRKNP